MWGGGGRGGVEMGGNQDGRELIGDDEDEEDEADAAGYEKGEGRSGAGRGGESEWVISRLARQAWAKAGKRETRGLRGEGTGTM